MEPLGLTAGNCSGRYDFPERPELFVTDQGCLSELFGLWLCSLGSRDWGVVPWGHMLEAR